MERFELIAPCHFGLEAVLKREILDLGYEISQVEDGRVTFYGDAEAVCRANVFLRTAERILIKAGSFKAVTFDELFEKTKQIPWEHYIREMEVLGYEGCIGKKQAVQSIGYSVNHEESDGGAVEELLPYFLV